MQDFFAGLPGIIMIILLFFVYIGWLHRTNSTTLYHTQNRTVGLTRTAASVISVIGAPHFAFITLLAFVYGWWALALYAGSFCGFIFLSFFTTHIRHYIAQDAHSYADIVKSLGLLPSIGMTLLAMLFTLGVLTAQLVTGGQLLSAVAPELNYTFAVALTSGAIILYLISGGYRALIATDYIQAIVMLLLTAFLAFHFTQTLSAQPFDIKTPTGANDIQPLIPMLFMAGIFLEIGAPVNWQRILTAKSNDAARYSMLLAAGLILFAGFLIVAVSNSIAEMFPDVNPSTAFVDVLTKDVQYWITGIAFITLLLALLSTADSALFILAVLPQAEWKRKVIETGSTRLSVRVTQLLIVVFGLLAAFLALYLPDLRAVFGALLNIGFITAPLALLVPLGRGGSTLEARKRNFLLALIAGVFAYFAIWFRIGDFFTYWSLLIPFVCSWPLLLKATTEDVGEG